ncbi:nuclease PA3 [Aulographum hederae CBS 113979]|uniref:Nuclease PA3 n=1 Tax=Aulographum hederae CBS 113979 TaxID=1176131 RepID=A0A6G1H5S7_9PEZI|nr:nuclease PA3 [Aulographum hederae CBS 113979]
MVLFYALLGSLSLLPVSKTWNTDVHNQIGFMAEHFLSLQTTEVLEQVLEPQYGGSIGRAAAWADSYAHTEEGSFSYQWHWIDSHDRPPTDCNLDFHRDCPEGGCVVRAIANQTQILRSCILQVKAGTLRDGNNLTCSYALKWISHFIGDITQPLHASGLAAGGNLIPTTFDGISTELHAVWDGYIIYSITGVQNFSNETISPYPASLLSRIEEDVFAEPISSWISCSDPSTPLRCALEWARESNAWTCKYVYSHDYNETDLLTDGYALEAYPIVEMQVSKAALRLATWLNRLVIQMYEQDRAAGVHFQINQQ